MLAGLAIVALVARNSWIELQAVPAGLAVPFLVAGFALVALYVFPAVLCWHLLMRWLGADMPVRRSAWVFVASSLGRYIPGKIWYVGGRVLLARQAGASTAAATAGVALELWFQIVTGLLLGLAFLPALVPSPAAWAGPAVAGLGVVVAAMAPAWFSRIALVKRLRLPGRLRRWVDGMAPICWQRGLAVMGLYVVSFVALGCGLFLLARAMAPVQVQELPRVVGGFPLAWVGGLVVAVVPAGIGVREAILTQVAGGLAPGFPANTFALLARLSTTVAEITWVVCVALLFARGSWRWSRRRLDGEVHPNARRASTIPPASRGWNREGG